jgi:hypothetical protein
MANANWSNPQLTSTYTNFVSEVKNRDEDLALQFDGTTSTNIPTNTIRWDSTANRWKKWNGTSWAELTSTYALTGLSTTGAATIGTTLGVTGAITGSSTVTGTALIPSGSTIPTNGIYLPSANSVAIATNSTQRLAISSGGAVTIPGSLTVTGTNTAASFIPTSSTTPTNGVYLPAANTVALATNSSERLRVDASGRLLVNTSTDFSDFGSPLQVVNNSGSTIDLGRFSNDINSPGLIFVKSRGSSPSIRGVVQSNDAIGALTFRADNGSAFSSGAAIGAYVDGTAGVGSVQARLVFSTTPSGSTSPTDRLTIDSSGRLLVGLSSTSANATVIFQGNSTSSTGPSVLLLQRGSTSLNSGQDIGFIRFADSQSSVAALIVGSADGNWTGSSFPSRLTFSTTTDGTSVPTERLRIDNSGRLLVGTSTALANVYVAASAITPQLQIEGNSGSTSSLSITRQTGAAANLILQRGVTGTPVAANNSVGQINFNGFDGTNFRNTAQITSEVDGTPGTDDMPGRLVFSTTADGASSPTEAMRINNQREVLIGTTNRTANGGVLQISNGITFPGTQSACSDPNTLDDYEEGSWTPAIAGLTVAGTGTYSVQVGRYTKIGNTVVAYLYLTWTAHTGTGSMSLSGLPFTTANVTNLDPVAIGYASTLTITGVPIIFVNPNATNASLNSMNNGTSAALAMDTAATLVATITYQAA